MWILGIVGDWKNHFTKEQHEQFMELFDEKLKDYPVLNQKFAPYLKL